MEVLQTAKKIVIVEDDPRFLENLQTYCEMLGHKIVATFNEACDSIFNVLPESDLILMDINLPGGESGVKFAKRINLEIDIPVIYITGNIEKETFEEASESLLHGYLPKPITKQQLDYAIKLSSVRSHYEKLMRKNLEYLYKNEKMVQVGKIAGALIHDLKNFNSIVVLSFYRIRKLVNSVCHSEESEKIITYIDRGESGARRIDELSERYRKILNSESSAKLVKIKVKSLLEEVVFYYENNPKNRDVKYEIECPEELEFDTFEIILLQALVVLVSNSLEAILELETKFIRLHASEVNQDIVFKVVDSVKGVSKKVIENLFELGFSSKSNDSGAGAGIGLSLVKENVETLLKGKVEYMDSEVNTTFQITLPKSLDPEEA